MDSPAAPEAISRSWAPTPVKRGKRSARATAPTSSATTRAHGTGHGGWWVSNRVTTAIDTSGRWRMSTDDARQVRQTEAVVDHIARLLRDEEAAGSNPATPTSSRATRDLRGWPRCVSYSSKVVQQRLGAELPREPPERPERVRIRDLGVHIHRHVDLRMTQDAHGHAWVHVERCQECGARVPNLMNRDAADARFITACLKPAVEVPRLVRGTGPGS
jgi:hypothetical protein